VRHGTAYGSLWLQIWITFKEAVLGFVVGVIAGVIVGVVLGQFRFFAEVLSPYIKVANAIPRIVLGSLFTVALGLGIATSQNNFNPDGVFAAMFIIAVLALTAEALIALLERRLLSWRPPSHAEAAAA
jgi:ABC-type nitrate/sulfonate/bicarbonate transport system permease component